MKFDSILENKQKGTIGWTIPKGYEVVDEIQMYVQNTCVSNGELLTIKGITGKKLPITCKLKIFRMGWYQGSGARQLLETEDINLKSGEIWTIDNEINENYVSKGPNWPIVHQIKIPVDWSDGLYIIKATTKDKKSVLTPFYLTTPNEAEGVTICFSPINIQARNWWGGASSTQVINGRRRRNSNLYHQIGREVLSINRPMYNPRGGDFLRWAYPLVRFIERHELPISYITDIDVSVQREIQKEITHLCTVGPMRYWTSRFERSIIEFTKIPGKTYAHLGAEAGQHIVRFDEKTGKIEIHGKDCFERLNNPVTGARPSGSKPRPPWSHMNLIDMNGKKISKIQGIIGSSWDRSFEEREVLAKGKGRHKLWKKRSAESTLKQSDSAVFNAGVSNWTWALSAFGRQGNVVVDEDVQKLTLRILGYDPEALKPNFDNDMILDDREVSTLPLADLDEILKKQPQNFDALLQSGIRLFDDGKFRIAHPRLMMAHRLKPRSILATYRLARNHHKLNNFEEMVPLYHELLRQRPDRYHYIIQYGNLQLALGNEEEGIEVMKYALSLREEPGPNTSTARYYRQKNDFVRALEFIDRALNLAPEDRGALAEKASLFESMGEFENAANLWNGILALSPKNERARMGYARTLYRSRNYDLAYQKLTQIIDDDITRYVRECALYCLNIASNHSRNDDEIIKICDLMLTKYISEMEHGKNGHVPVTNICLALSRRLKTHQAIEYLDKYGFLYENQAEMNLVRARIYQESGGVEEYFSSIKSAFSQDGSEDDSFISEDPQRRLLVKALISKIEHVVDGPLVSVIMTVYKHNELLEAAIDSILCQTYRNIELIIVDDASPDDVMEFLLEKAESDPRIIVVSMDTNGGTYIAKNQGMKISNGDYLAFHDSDDWLHPRKLEVSISHLENNPKIVAVFSNYFRVDENGVIIFKGNGAVRPACISLTMRRNEMISEIGYFDSVRVSADSEYEYRIKSHFGSERIAFLPTPYLVASVRSESLSQGGKFAVGWSGLSGVRLEYRKSYTKWHHSEQFKANHFISNDPYTERKFEAPNDIL